MKKILIIEDDVFLGDVLLQKMTKEGYETELARDGKEGFEKIKTMKPDLVLLDIVLPNMNGYEILEAKQIDKNISSIPVIVISNSGQPVEINRVLEFGVKDYLVKAQFDPQEVLEKVKNQFLSEAEKKPKETSDVPSVSLEGKKILWVEDDKFLNDIIARKLASTKCIFSHTADGEEALQMIANDKPDIILLDIILSGIDGYEILRRIKSDSKMKDIPVILLSNLGQPSDTEKGKSMGAARFLVKATVTLDEILDEIKQVLAESKK